MTALGVDIRCYSQTCRGAKASVKVGVETATVRCTACAGMLEVPQWARAQAAAALQVPTLTEQR